MYRFTQCNRYSTSCSFRGQDLVVIEEAVLALSQPGANYTKARIESHDFLMRLVLGVVGLAGARTPSFWTILFSVSRCFATTFRVKQFLVFSFPVGKPNLMLKSFPFIIILKSTIQRFRSFPATLVFVIKLCFFV